VLWLEKIVGTTDPNQRVRRKGSWENQRAGIVDQIILQGLRSNNNGSMRSQSLAKSVQTGKDLILQIILLNKPSSMRPIDSCCMGLDIMVQKRVKVLTERTVDFASVQEKNLLHPRQDKLQIPHKPPPKTQVEQDLHPLSKQIRRQPRHKDERRKRKRKKRKKRKRKEEENGGKACSWDRRHHCDEKGQMSLFPPSSLHAQKHGWARHRKPRLPSQGHFRKRKGSRQTQS